MPDNIENYLQKLKDQGKRGRVKSSRAASKKNIGKRTGKTISGIGGVADVSGLFRSFDSDSNASTTSFSTKTPLNSTFKASKDGKRRLPPPSYDNSDSEEDNVILSPQPAQKESHENQDSSYHSNSPVGKSALEPLDVSLSKTYVDQATQCMTPYEDSPVPTNDASHIKPTQVSTAAVTSNVVLSGRSSGKSGRRDQRQAKASITKSFRDGANSESQTSKPSEDEAPSTPGSQSNILNEYRQMISAEKSRGVVPDGTKIGSLTKKTAMTPTYSKQSDLRRRLSFKTGVPDGRSPRTVAAIVQENVANTPLLDFELDGSSSGGRNEVIVEANDPNAAEKVGLAFVPTPKVNHPSLLKRRRSSAKKDHRSSSNKSRETASAKQKSSSKSQFSEPEKPEMESGTQSRGRPKLRQKLFQDSSDKRDSSSSVGAVRSAARPQSKSKKSLSFRNSRWDTSTSGERQPSKSVKKIVRKSDKARLVTYSSSSDEEFFPSSLKTRGKTSTERSPLKSVQNHVETTALRKKSERKRQSYNKSSAEDSEGVRKTPRKRHSFYKTLAESDIEFDEDYEEPIKSRVSVPKSTDNKKGKTQKTTTKQQGIKSGNEADDTDACSDVPPKKKRSTGIRISLENSGNEERSIANLSQTSGCRIRNRFYSDSSSDSENEHKTVIEKNNKSTDQAKIPKKTKRSPKISRESHMSSNPDSDFDDRETLPFAGRETDDGSKLQEKQKPRSTIGRKNDRSTNHKNSSKRPLHKKGRKNSSERNPSSNRHSDFDHSESETDNTAKVRGKHKSTKGTGEPTASSSLQAWLDSGHGKITETIRLPTPQRDTSPDITKSAAISRRSRKVVIESDENPLESEPDHPPLPMVDESAINNTFVEHGGGRPLARALGRIGPPASTPRAAKRVAALSRRNLEAHAREESVLLPPAAPIPTAEDPDIDDEFEIIHTDTEDSRDYITDDSYTLRKPKRKENPLPLKKPTTKQDKAATSKLEILSVDVDADDIMSDSNGGAQRSRATARSPRKHRVENESTSRARSPRKRRKDNTSISGDRKSKSTNNESKTGGKPKKKKAQKTDENDRTLVAGDNENTLVTETKQNNRPAKSKKTKLKTDALLLHQRELDLVIPKEDDGGLRRSKRVRASRPLGFGEALVYEWKDRFSTLVGIQTDNGIQKIDVESHQGERVHILSQSVLVEPRKKGPSNKKRPSHKKKQNQKPHNEPKRPSAKAAKNQRSTSRASTSRRETDGDENSMQWFDNLGSATAMSSVMEEDTSTNRTVQLFDCTVGGLVMTDVSSIVNDGRSASARPIISEKGVNISKWFKRDGSVTGKLDIEPRREKETRIVHKGEMHFFISRGRVNLSVGDLNVTVKEHGSFVVPRKNQYSLFNPSNNVKAELFYAMVRQNPERDENAGD